MDKLMDFWQFLARQRNDHDFVDQLYFRVTPRILLCFSFIIVAKEYGGNPIDCWSKAEWPRWWNHYANDYCFVEGTYYVNVHDDLDKTEDRYKRYISIDYYPWLAFMLTFQALIFYLPYAVWSNFNGWSGLAVRAVASAAHLAAFNEFGLSSKERRQLSNHIISSLKLIRNNYSNSSEVDNEDDRSDSISASNVFSRFYRRFVGPHVLVMLYLSMKLLFLVNAYFQLKFISSFLGKSSSIRDVRSWLMMLWDNRSWEQTGKFPRIGMCDFMIRDQDSVVLKYTLQCVLLANMINEKIFIITWLWLWILMSIGIVNFGYWLAFLFLPGRTDKFVINAILQGDASNEAAVFDEYNEIVKKQDEKTAELCDLTENLQQNLKRQGAALCVDYKLARLKNKWNAELKECREQFCTFDCSRQIYDLFIRYIGLDSVLMFRLVELNASTPVTNEILSQLFYDYIINEVQENESNKTKVSKLPKSEPAIVTKKTSKASADCQFSNLSTLNV